MKVLIESSETLATLRPFDVAIYLRTHGWEPAETYRGAVRYLFAGEDDLEILLPTERSWRDFVLRMSETLKVLSAAEERSELEILQDLTLTSFDVVRVRVQPKTGENSSIPVDDGVALVEQGRNMMLAAACSAVEPRPQYPTRKPALAVEYLRNVRLGQTERGSYIATLISPVAPFLTPSEEGRLFPDVEEPFERRVVRTLASAVQATKDAATAVAVTSAGINVFREAIDQGISANLCEALAEMGGESQRGLAISFAWSLARPAPEQVPTITLEDDTIPVISEAARILRETSPQPDVTLTGTVVRLERTVETGPGRVSILGVADGEVKRATVDLEAADYDLAIMAHRDGRVVTVQGDLVKEGRGFVLATPRDFRVLPEA
jgi:hypothetical protein